MGNPDPAPNRVGPSQLPVNFVDGNCYIVLGGVVEARDCEVGWNNVMKACGGSDEKVVAKNFESLFNAARSEDQAREPNRHAAPSDPRAAVPVSQETDMSIQHDPIPLLLVARVHARVHCGGSTPGIRTNEGVHKGEICINLPDFVRDSYKIRTNFVRISYEFTRIHAYESATGLPCFDTCRFGRRLGMVHAFGAGLSLDDA